MLTTRDLTLNPLLLAFQTPRQCEFRCDLLKCQTSCMWFGFPKAAVTKCHPRKLCSYSSGGQKAQIKGLAGLVPSEGCEEQSCLSAFCWFAGNPARFSAQRCTIRLRPVFTGASMCLCLCVQIPPFQKDTSHTGLGPSLTTSS